MITAGPASLLPPPILNVLTARPTAEAQEQAPSEAAFRVGQANAFRPMGHVHAACSSIRAGSGGGTGEPAAREADRQRLLVRQAGRGGRGPGRWMCTAGARRPGRARSGQDPDEACTHVGAAS